MTTPEIAGIAPFFIVRNVPAALSFYRDRLGFDIMFQGPDPNDIFFGIVRRGAAMIMLKDVGVDPLPNHKRDIGKGWARWDAYLNVPDPDALAAEFSSRQVESERTRPAVRWLLNRSFSTIDHQLRSVRRKLGARSAGRLVRTLARNSEPSR